MLIGMSVNDEYQSELETPQRRQNNNIVCVYKNNFLGVFFFFEFQSDGTFLRDILFRYSNVALFLEAVWI